jgi:hypothetical protein
MGWVYCFSPTHVAFALDFGHSEWLLGFIGVDLTGKTFPA